jgi:hypothetical protein
LINKVKYYFVKKKERSLIFPRFLWINYNVVKLFLWKALPLPTRTNLARKGVITEAKCPICGPVDESVEHILWSCSSSMDVWGGGPRSLQKCDVTESTFPTLFEGLMRRCNKEDLELFAVTARRIWLRRNSVVHGEPFTHPSQLLREAQNSLEDFQWIHNEVGSGSQNARDLTEVQWKPPVEGMIKLNWDAGLNMKEGRVGIGIIARDSRGVCLAARSLSLNTHIDATTAEALAAVHAIMFCKELGYANLIFEGDALQIIKAIGEEGPCLSSFGHLIECIRNELRELECASFIHVMREANGAAHMLAHLATTHVTFSTWLGDVPPSVGDIVRREQSLLLV